MGAYKNFKTVVYCVAYWVENITEEELNKQIEWFSRYVKIDKVYVETFRELVASEKQILMCKRVFEEHGIEVAGGITTVIADQNDTDSRKRQRLFHTGCYSNEAMRNTLRDMSAYTAKFFDEFIIDDFFFTQCMCEDCIREKGNRSVEEFRKDKMIEVSKNLIIAPAKAVNPNVKITIKYPNWRESYQETGYRPKEQHSFFDMIYTGTETRHPRHTDQHLPRYLSYSIMRFMDNTDEAKNGGGWFDPFECYPIDTYLEQAYLTAFARPKEVMMFCWSALYQNKVITPLGFQLEKIDNIMSEIGKPFGTPVYLPHCSQGEDHIEDYLGMVGIALDPTPDFPENAATALFTAAALYDKDIVTKLKAFVAGGHKAIVTNGFMAGALEMYPEIKDMTSIRNRNRRVFAKEYFINTSYNGDRTHEFIEQDRAICFAALDHRNNASWSLMNGGDGDFHTSLLLQDTYGEGEMLTMVLPEMYSNIKHMPEAILRRIRYEFATDSKIYLEAPAGISIFTYDDGSFGLYSYACEGSKPVTVYVHMKKQVAAIKSIPEAEEASHWSDEKKELKPWRQDELETVFAVPILPGDYKFFKEIIK